MTLVRSTIPFYTTPLDPFFKLIVWESGTSHQGNQIMLTSKVL
jgi:hypothetical protein